MPKLRRPPPEGVMFHLVERFRDGRIAVADFIELKHWVESEAEVRVGPWFKRFANFTLAGEGEMPKTFLTPEMNPRGKEVQ